MRSLGAQFVKRLKPGQAVLLFGPLGSGKTTFVRGMLHGLGWDETVRSPTFNLVQVFDTNPPLTHADLYRVKSPAGLGIEDYLQTHICAIEWAERLQGLIDPKSAWRIKFAVVPSGRRVEIEMPESKDRRPKDEGRK